MTWRALSWWLHTEAIKASSELRATARTSDLCIVIECVMICYFVCLCGCGGGGGGWWLGGGGSIAL